MKEGRRDRDQRNGELSSVSDLEGVGIRVRVSMCERRGEEVMKVGRNERKDFK